ncbi:MULTISPECIES: hypothetical protein [unclassified Caballeronia]|uniref:hypothetical protein n=1 Tax=unclassified Caballeronia TaxID=2646786 RepID=UPI002027854E|nr:MULTISPECIES: hypothetical protein [unclassified Caballeronia]MDR5763810.1 hypothetical protein [Caballeronia sp. LZ028]
MPILEWLVESLRSRGLHDEADTHEAVHAGEASGSAPAGVSASYGHDDDRRVGGRGERASVNPGVAARGAEPSATPGNPGGPDAGHGVHPDDIDGGGAHDTAAAIDRGGEAAARHSNFDPDRLHEHQQRSPELDSHDPLAGLYSGRLRASLAREAFRSASASAQDAAIAERVLSPNFDAFMEMAERAMFPAPQPIDEWRTGRRAAIDAVGDALPRFARGDTYLDPSITRATDAGPALSQHAEPACRPMSSTTVQRTSNQALER